MIGESKKLKGGKSDNKTIDDIVSKNLKKGVDYSEIETKVKKNLSKGVKIEMEHSDDKLIAKEIAMDHLYEDLDYYDKLEKIESKEATDVGSAGGYSQPLFGDIKKSIKESLTKSDYKKAEEILELIKNEDIQLYRQILIKVIDVYAKFGDIEELVKSSYKVSDKNKEEVKKIAKRKETKEATGSGSSGSYETTAAWAKSTKKKDWRGRSKTQIPGGKFVTIKKKCKNFPYCNQGDIKALKLYEDENFKRIMSNISEKYNVPVNVIKSVIQNEIEISRNKSTN